MADFNNEKSYQILEWLRYMFPRGVFISRVSYPGWFIWEARINHLHNVYAIAIILIHCYRGHRMIPVFDRLTRDVDAFIYVDMDTSYDEFANELIMLEFARKVYKIIRHECDEPRHDRYISRARFGSTFECENRYIT